MTNLIDHEIHDLGPLGPEIEHIQKVAEAGAPVAYEHRVELVQGDTIERINTNDNPAITIVKDTDPDVDKVRISAQAEKADETGRTNYSARVISAVYPGGDNFTHGKAEIRKVLPDGTEKVLESKRPERAKWLGAAIAKRLAHVIKHED